MRRALFIGVLCAQLGLWHHAPPITRNEQAPARSRLHKHDRLRLVEARAQDRPDVTVLIASNDGANHKVVLEIERLGGKVLYREDEIDYLRAQTPTASVEKLSYSTAIKSMNLAGKIDYLSSLEQEITTHPKLSPSRVRPPDKDTPRVNPYLPSGDIGAPQFIASHPAFDGRGVVIAILDTNIDMLAPELQTAKALDGTPLPKFADVLTAAPDSISASEDGSHIGGYLRVDMQTGSAATNGKLLYQDRFYTAPRDGLYRIGMLNERTGSSTGDLNRDGNPAGSSGLFAVLWDEGSNNVWIDTNQNFNFTDEKPMTDYSLRRDIGTFGKDDPRTAIRETIGFTVQTDRRHKTVFVIPGYGGHGTGVAGVAAGNSFFGGQIEGVAPAAQLISIPYGGGPGITASFIESAILAMKDARVDVVSMQFGNFLPLNDGRSTFSIICNRLVNRYQKPMFVSAGNATDWLNAIQSPADAEQVMAVGSYLGNETSRVNYGVTLKNRDNLNGYSSHGPTKEGGLKPNLLAPTTSLTLRPGFQSGENRYETYALPPGYQITGGTSTSAPFAAAAAALLISAAKQSGVKYDPKRLRWAMMTTARFLPHRSAELQGAGLLQVEAAWEALKSAPAPIDIVSRTPIDAALAEYLEEPNQGTGIYEREGWTAGQSGQRTITFIRTSGRPEPMTFSLNWLGNDGTFSCPAQITLPLNVPVPVNISISPKESGVHSALLNLSASNGPVHYQVMNTIVAAEQLGATNLFTITRDGQAGWLHSQSYFVNVPAGASALRVDVRISEGTVMPSLLKPNGAFYYSLAPDQVPLRYTRYQEPGLWSRIVSRPDPGVWQIVLDNCNLSGPSARGASASFSVSATLLGVTFNESELSPDASNWQEVSYTNLYGAFSGEIAKLGLASAFTTNVTLDQREPLEFEIDVAPGATQVGAMLSASETAPADLDLYLFDCTGRECVLRDFAAGSDSTAHVAVENPSAGTWKVMLDPFKPPPPDAKFQYNDYFLHPAFGAIQTQSGPTQVEHGAVVKQRVRAQINAVPIGVRHLEAFLFVVGYAGPNSEDPKKISDWPSYYADKGIAGVANLKLGIPTRNAAAR